MFIVKMIGSYIRNIDKFHFMVKCHNSNLVSSEGEVLGGWSGAVNNTKR